MAGAFQSKGELLLYTNISEDGRGRVEYRLQEEMILLLQAWMAELFGRYVRTINKYLRNLFEEEELETRTTVRNPVVPGASSVHDYFDELLAHESALVLYFASSIATWAIRSAGETGYEER